MFATKGIVLLKRRWVRDKRNDERNKESLLVMGGLFKRGRELVCETGNERP